MDSFLIDACCLNETVIQDVMFNQDTACTPQNEEFHPAGNRLFGIVSNDFNE